MNDSTKNQEFDYSALDPEMIVSLGDKAIDAKKDAIKLCVQLGIGLLRLMEDTEMEEDVFLRWINSENFPLASEAAKKLIHLAEQMDCLQCSHCLLKNKQGMYVCLATGSLWEEMEYSPTDYLRENSYCEDFSPEDPIDYAGYCADCYPESATDYVGRIIEDEEEKMEKEA